MSDPKTTEAPKFPFDMTAMLGGFSPEWQKMMADQVTRLSAMGEEMAKAEARAHADAKKMIEESARLALATLQWSQDLSSAYRKMAVDAMKRTADAAPVVETKPSTKA